MRMRTARRGRVTLLAATACIFIGLAGCSGQSDAAPEVETSSASDSPIYATETEKTSEPEFTDAQQEAIEFVESHSWKSMSASEFEIRKNMPNSGFSEEEVDFALENSGVSFSENAVLAADYFAEDSSKTREEVLGYLVDVRRFTEERAEAAAEDYRPEG